MANKFKLLDCGTDILTIDKDTFTVERLKELLKIEMYKKFHYQQQEERNKERFTHRSLFEHLSTPKIPVIQNYLDFSLTDALLIFPPEGREAQLLKIGSPGWETGKMRIKARVLDSQIEVELEFCDDELPKPESPLDDFRQGEEYQKLVNRDS